MDHKNVKSKEKVGAGIKFCLVIFMVYFAVALFNIHIAKAAVINFIHMFIKIVPILGVVFIVMIGVNLYFTPQKTQKYLGKESGVMGWIYAIISGILVSGPPYILYPMLGELKKQGMKNSLLAVFLYNRNVKIPFIPAMIYYFGIKFTIIISFYIILFSFLNGKIIEALTQEN